MADSSYTKAEYELSKARGCLEALDDELDTFDDYVNRYESNPNERNAEAVCYEAARDVRTWRDLLATARDIVKAQEIAAGKVMPVGGEQHDIKHA
ncbi:hypothetical protein [Schleiferilactobacillus harbinensis]|uniref:Uncharacterized protein n=1 Tax=Schleiferilactobacillus harbinensis TaxID=304207 RepID=A0ABU7T0X4_9LACO